MAAQPKRRSSSKLKGARRYGSSSGRKAGATGQDLAATVQWIALGGLFLLIVIAIFVFEIGGAGAGGGHSS